jgi:hypothetical protein
MSLEYAPRPGIDEGEIGLENGVEQNTPPEVKEIIEAIYAECSHVNDYPANGAMLDQLIENAKESSDANPQGWQELLKSTKQKLLNADEDDEKGIEDILRAAISEGTGLVV